jgi:hypothetical protein
MLHLVRNCKSIYVCIVLIRVRLSGFFFDKIRRGSLLCVLILIIKKAKCHVQGINTRIKRAKQKSKKGFLAIAI